MPFARKFAVPSLKSRSRTGRWWSTAKLFCVSAGRVEPMAIRRILIANRGEIAARIIRTCRALNIEAVLAVSEADRISVPAKLADRTVCIGPARAGESYLNAAAIVQAALGTHSDAVHPGYGFL